MTIQSIIKKMYEASPTFKIYCINTLIIYHGNKTRTINRHSYSWNINVL